MELFSKNDVQVDHPYQIDHREKEAPTLACPRCGHVQPRKKNVVCAHCNRMVPTEKSRQTWTDLPKNEYREKAKEFFGEKDLDNKSFSKSKGSYGWQQRTRSLVLAVFLAVVVVVPAVFGLKAYLGDETWKNVEKDVEAMVAKIEGMKPLGANATATAENTAAAAAAPAVAKHKSKSAKSRRRSRSH